MSYEECLFNRLCECVVCRAKLCFKLMIVSLQTGHLAMETLLSLTSKRAGDWFKEELRLLGGLDHIVDKGEVGVCVCVCVPDTLETLPLPTRQ